MQLYDAKVILSPGGKPRAEQLAELMRLSQSSLEKEWLDYLEKWSLNIPDTAQALIRDCGTRPDFLYKEQCVAVYIDGPPHDFKDRQERDKEKEDCLRNLGYTVLRFHHQSDWTSIIKKYPNIFGVTK
jgi:very-short-patch-repair endonuclease